MDTPSQDRPNRERGLAQKYANAGQITTLMLRNIPSMYTQDMLLEEIIDCMGSSESFDFFYLPWDLQNDCNVGYAFINFRDVASAERCTRIFTNFNFRNFDSRRTCKVFPAHIQGLENNLRHLMDRAVSEAHSHYPIIMWKGEKLKLGKVIAALDGQRVNQPPKSAPGKSLTESHARDIGPVPSWPPPQQLPIMPESSCNFRSPPASVGCYGGMDRAWNPEADMLQHMPEVRAALHQGNRGVPHQALGPREPGIVMPPYTGGMATGSSGPVTMPMSMPGRLPGAGQPHGGPFRQPPPQLPPQQLPPPPPQQPAPGMAPVSPMQSVIAPVQEVVPDGGSGGENSGEVRVRDPNFDVFAKFAKKFNG